MTPFMVYPSAPKVLLRPLTQLALGLTVSALMSACGTNTPAIQRITTVEGFSQVKSLKGADYLFVIDSSASMSIQVQRLQANLSSFTTQLQQANVDYRIGITDMAASNTSTSKGLIGNRLLTLADNANLNYAFSQMVDGLHVGQILSPNRPTGIHAALQLLKYDGDITAKSLLRENVPLLVVFISDDDDRSINCNLNSKGETVCSNYYKSDFAEDLQAYVSDFKSLKKDASKIKVKAIISKSGKGCSDNLGSTQKVGTRYMNLVVALGGSLSSDALDICDNWSNTLNNLAVEMKSMLTRFKLKQVPDVNSNIVVKVNGKPVQTDATNGFVFLSATNEIEFRGDAIPSSEATIEVQFVPQN